MKNITYNNYDFRLDESNMTAGFTGGKGLLDSLINYPGQNRTSGEKVYIPESVCYEGKVYTVKSIIGNSLDRNLNIQELHIPSTIEHIDWGMYKCYLLKAYYVAKNNPFFKEKDGVLFSKQKRELIAYPNLHAEEYHIPEGTTSIRGRAFKSCIALKKVVIPSSVIRMGANVFYDCGETDIYLPEDFKIKQIYTKNSDKKHYSQLRFHYCGKVYSVDSLNNLLIEKYNLK